MISLGGVGRPCRETLINGRTEQSHVVKGKCQILHLGMVQPWILVQHGGMRALQSSPMERDLWVLADSKVNVNQQCALECTRPSTASG